MDDGDFIVVTTPGVRGLPGLNANLTAQAEITAQEFTPTLGQDEFIVTAFNFDHRAQVAVFVGGMRLYDPMWSVPSPNTVLLDGPATEAVRIESISGAAPAAIDVEAVHQDRLAADASAAAAATSETNAAQSEQDAAASATTASGAASDAVDAKTDAQTAASTATTAAGVAENAAATATTEAETATAAAVDAIAAATAATNAIAVVQGAVTTAVNAATDAQASAVEADNSATAAGLSADSAATNAVTAGDAATATAADVVLTHADAVATAADRVAVHADRVAADADAVATAADRVATHADRVGADTAATTSGVNATAAANSATAAAGSATAAAGSETAAAGSATAAAASATAAAGSATAADASADDAADSVVEAQAIADSLQMVNLDNTGGAVGTFRDKVGLTFEMKSLVPGPAGNVEFTDLGSQVRLDVSLNPDASFDIPFTDHAGGGNFHFKTPRAAISKFAAAENIVRMSIITPYPVDTTELKAAITIKLAGRMAVAITPNDAQKFYMDGTLYLDREGGNWISGTPTFDGNSSSGMKLQVGTVSGFLTIEITFRLGASAREIEYCIVGGTAYSAATTTQAMVLNINGTAITGAVDVFGASGLVALVVNGQTSQTVPAYYESRGRWLTLFGQVVNTGNWANGTLLFTLPAPFTARHDNTLVLFSALAAGLPAGSLLPSQLIFAISGTVTLAANYPPNNLLFSGMAPVDLRGF